MLFFTTLLSRYPPVTDDGLHLRRCSGFSLSLWLTATPSPLRPRCYANHGEHCSGNITQDLLAPFSSCSLGSCFTGDARGGGEEMMHVPLFKGCFGYIRDLFFFYSFFICCRPKPCLHLSFCVNGNALTAIWSSATQGGCGAGLWFTATH